MTIKFQQILSVSCLLFLLVIPSFSGCGGSGGPSQGSVTVSALPNPVTGTMVEENTKKQWQWTCCFAETGGSAVTFTSYDRVIVGSNSYREESYDNTFDFSVAAGDTSSYNFTLISARTAEGTPAYVAGTSDYAFHGSDAGGRSVTANLAVNLE